jgi:hypothetical protein
MANIGNLVVRLQAQTDAFRRGMADARQSVTRFADAAKRQTDRVRAVFGALGGVVKAAMGALAAYGLSLAGISVAITRSATAIDQLAKHADKLGIAVNELQFLRFAADQTGVSMQSLDTGLQRMTRRVAEAAQGTGAAKNALEELGLSASQLNAMSPDQQFQAIARAMANIGNQGDKVRLAMQIFDTEGVGLVNTMAANLEDLRSEFDELGLSLTRSQAAAVESFNDSRSKLAQIFDGIRNHVTATVAPALQLMIDKVVDWIKQMGGASEAAKVVSHWVLNFVDAGLRGIGQVIQSLKGMEIGWKKVELGIIAVIDAATRLANTFTPSVWAQKFGINFADTGIQTLQKAMESRGVEVAGQILELERLQGQGGWTDVVSQQIEELRQRINESRSAEETLAQETKRSTEASAANTSAMLELQKAYTSDLNDRIKGGKDTGTIDYSSKAEDKQFRSAEVFEAAARRFQEKIDHGLLDPRSAAMNIASLQTMANRYEGAGGFDIKGMRAAIENLGAAARDMFATPKEKPLTAQDYERVFKEAQAKAEAKEKAQEAALKADIEAEQHLRKIAESMTKSESPKGSITIKVQSDKGETAGDVTGDTAFLSKLASTLQSVSTAV